MIAIAQRMAGAKANQTALLSLIKLARSTNPKTYMVLIAAFKTANAPVLAPVQRMAGARAYLAAEFSSSEASELTAR